jgi:hypothetical protein
MIETIETKLIKFYDAVIADDGMEVQRILKDNIFAQSKLTTKMITGMLIIAVENGLTQAGQAIIAHNSFTPNQIADKHLDTIMRLAFKNNLFTPLSITLN